MSAADDEPDLIKIPFSELNDLPLVRGRVFRDIFVPADLPEFLELELEDKTLSFSDVQGAVRAALTNAFQQEPPIDLPDALDEEEITAAVEDALLEPGAAGKSVVDIIVNRVAEEIEQPELPTDEIVEQLLEELDTPVTLSDETVSKIVERIVRQIDVGPGTELDVDIDGVFGPLAEDIADGLERALERIIGLPDDLPEEIDSLTEALVDTRERLIDLQERLEEGLTVDIEGEIEETLNELPGTNLILEPEVFLEELSASVESTLVSEEAADELRESRASASISNPLSAFDRKQE